MNAGAELMAPHIKNVEEFLSSTVYTKSKDKDKVFAAWLEIEGQDVTKKTRKLIAEMARTKFAIIIGQSWFSEFKSLDENKMKIKLDKKEWECSVEMSEVQINI